MLWARGSRQPVASFRPAITRRGNAHTHGLISVEWSSQRPAVFITAATDGTVFVYDLCQSSMHPVSSLNVIPDIKGKGSTILLCTSLNGVHGDVLAAGCGPTLCVWKMGGHLEGAQGIDQEEEETLRALAQTAMKVD